MSREENVKVFEDTERLCKTNQILQQSIQNSRENQVLIIENDTVDVPNEKRYKEKAEIVVSKKRTYEAASAYKDQKVAVLNFASASNPGGGVVRGANAQEECLCRCSTLYFSLNTDIMWQGFYTPHRGQGDPLHNDDCIYTPDVTVFKTDTANPVLMSEEEWYQVNVITCAAPNLREKPSNRMNPGDGRQTVKINNKDLQLLHERRLRRILDIAKKYENDVVILGAFGCGAFYNPPQVVAESMRNVVREYLYDFKTIEFAVYCRDTEDINYQTFNRVMKTI